METLKIVIQLVVALGVFNVWILRYSKASKWRGGDASNMRQEFDTYGLPEWSVYVVGAAKLLLAILLVAGIWITDVISPAAIGIGLLMLGAIAMHVKVNDTLIKSLPAFTMLVLSVLLVIL